MRSARISLAALALLGAAVLPETADALPGFFRRSVTGFDAGDLARDVVGEDGLVTHDIEAALGHGAVEDAAERAYSFVERRVEQDLQDDRLRDLDDAGRDALRESWREAGRGALRQYLGDDLRAVATKEKAPARKYLSNRYDETPIRDAALGLHRRGNLESIFGGFDRYSSEDEARIDDAKSRVGEARYEAILTTAADNAGYIHVRRIAYLCYKAIAARQLPSAELLRGVGDWTFENVVDWVRRKLEDRPRPPIGINPNAGTPIVGLPWLRPRTEDPATNEDSFPPEGDAGGAFGQPVADLAEDGETD